MFAGVTTRSSRSHGGMRKTSMLAFHSAGARTLAARCLTLVLGPRPAGAGLLDDVIGGGASCTPASCGRLPERAARALDVGAKSGPRRPGTLAAGGDTRPTGGERQRRRLDGPRRGRSIFHPHRPFRGRGERPQPHLEGERQAEEHGSCSRRRRWARELEKCRALSALRLDRSTSLAARWCAREHGVAGPGAARQGADRAHRLDGMATCGGRRRQSTARAMNLVPSG